MMTSALTRIESTADMTTLIGTGMLFPITRASLPPGRLTGVSIWDPRSDAPLSGHLVLMIGVDGDNLVSAFNACVGDVVRRGGAGVVIDGPVSEQQRSMIEKLAALMSVSVLARNPSVPWLALVDTVKDLVRSADPGAHASAPIGDLTSLAESLAELLGGPVIIEDAKFRVLSYSSSTARVDPGRDSAILSRRTPDSWLAHLESVDAMETLLSTEDVISVEHGPDHARPRVLRAVRVDGFMIGIIWVAEGATPLPADMAERMHNAARIAAPHLVRHHEETFGHRSAQLRMLRNILEAGIVSRSAAEDLGIAPAAHYALIGIRTLDDRALPQGDRNRTVETLALYCQSYRWRVATTAIGHTIYCLIAIDDDKQQDRVPALAENLVAAARRTTRGRPFLAVVSDPIAELGETPLLRAQLDEALAVLEKCGTTTATTYARVLPRILLGRLTEMLRREKLGYPKVEAVIAHDCSNRTDYARTIRAYLDSFGNATAAAAQLDLHVTTLRYRLRKVEELFDLDFTDPEQRLACELALRASVSGPASVYEN